MTKDQNTTKNSGDNHKESLEGVRARFFDLRFTPCRCTQTRTCERCAAEAEMKSRDYIGGRVTNDRC
jgi:hypothetical protein